MARDKAATHLNGLNVGDDVSSRGGTDIYRIKKGTLTVDPGSIATVTRGSIAVTLTGVATGDLVFVTPPATLEDDLIPIMARVTAADTVTIYIYNPTGLAIDGASLTWDYLWLDLT